MEDICLKLKILQSKKDLSESIDKLIEMIGLYEGVIRRLEQDNEILKDQVLELNRQQLCSLYGY